MKSKLFVSVCVTCLLGVSVAAYADKYMEGDGKIPKGDCLEMLCPNGCVEEEGSLTGHCCPGGDSCRVDGKDVPECCGEGQTCKEGKCQAEEKMCEPHLFKKSANQMKNSKDGENPIICCDGEITTSGNTDTNTRGYEKDGNTQKGCCPKDRTNKTNSDPKKWTCCTKTQKAVSTGCCQVDPINKVYVDTDGKEKCCPVTNQLPKYNQSCNITCGCFNGTLTCDSLSNPSAPKCVCAEGYHYNTKQKACVKCPSGSSWDESEKACIAEATLSVETDNWDRCINFTGTDMTSCSSFGAQKCSTRLPNCNCKSEVVTLTLRAASGIDFETTSWQIMGSDEKAKIKGHIQQADCKGYSGEYSLTDNEVSSDGFSDFEMLKHSNEKCPQNANIGKGAGQHLYTTKEVSGNEVKFEIHVNGIYGIKCKYEKGRGVEGQVYKETIRLKQK